MPPPGDLRPDPVEAHPEGGGFGKLLSPARRQACVNDVVAEHGVSQRFACRALGQRRSTQRKCAVVVEDETALTAAIVALALQYGRYG